LAQAAARFLAAQRVTNLPRRFGELVQRLGAAADPRPLADAVLAAWAEPDRRYHDLDHLRDCLAELDGAPADGADRDRVEAALWFHDAIYDPRAGDNEARSAEWARRALAGLGIPPDVADDVARLVRLTGHTEPTPDPSGRLLCDIDLGILGREPEAFDAYDRRIRDEYAWVPEPDFRAARTGVLAALLDRSPLYQTEHFRRRYETAARTNLVRALERLGHGRT
jgi:predicted metal-dependent HD superfamily phosphohydrolase